MAEPNVKITVLSPETLFATALSIADDIPFPRLMEIVAVIEREDRVPFLFNMSDVAVNKALDNNHAYFYKQYNRIRAGQSFTNELASLLF